MTCVPISSDLNQRRSLGTFARGSFGVDDKLNRGPQPEGFVTFWRKDPALAVQAASGSPTT